MSSVTGADGITWNWCHGCGGWEQFEFLGYEEPSTEHPYGRDLCRACVEDPSSMEARRIANRAQRDREIAAHEATSYPTTCGHGQLPGKTVYDFQQEETASPAVESYKVLTYCSQACKDEATKGGE